MTAKQVIERIEAAGGTLTVHGERIRCRAPREAAYLVEELRAHRDEVRRLLEERQRLADRGTSRLALFRVGMKVWTPMGPGIVADLHPDRASVRYEDGTRMAWLDGEGMLPMAQVPGPRFLPGPLPLVGDGGPGHSLAKRSESCVRFRFRRGCQV